MPKSKKKKLPPDPEGQNDDREDWANTALRTFMKTTGADREDALCDLLCDLMHWCDRNGQDFDRELARARNHYRDETTPDPNADGFTKENAMAFDSKP